MFLLADKSIQSDEIVKVSIPDLSPYPNALGHVWVANPTGGGNKTFYKEHLKDIALPAVRARAETKTKLQHLAQSSAAPNRPTLLDSTKPRLRFLPLIVKSIKWVRPWLKSSNHSFAKSVWIC